MADDFGFASDDFSSDLDSEPLPLPDLPDTGSPDDLLARLESLIPGGWFNYTAPVRDAVLGGLSDALANSYALLVAVRAQTRIKSSSGWFLDLAAWDFFGARFLRRRGEYDDRWCARIIAEILRERITRKGIRQAIVDLTGLEPTITQPWSPEDNAAYGCSFYGYGTYGSLQLPNQIFIIAHRPQPMGIANVAGYGYGFYGAPTTAYIDISEASGAVSDSEIYATIAATKAAGITAWVSIQ